MNRFTIAVGLYVAAAGLCSAADVSPNDCLRDAAIKFKVPQSVLQAVYVAENGGRAANPTCSQYDANGRALAGALERTKGDTARAMAYLHGGETGLSQFDRARRGADRAADGECPTGYAPLPNNDYCFTLKGTLVKKSKPAAADPVRTR